MATFLDLGLIEFFLPVFYTLLIFAMLFALTSKIGLFGENKSMIWIFSLGLTFVIMFSGSALELINFVTPWYGFLAIFLFFTFLVLGFLGLKQDGGSRDEDSILRQIGGGTFIWVIILIILIIGIGNVFSGALFPYNEGGIDSLTLKTIFHPRVLGAFLILIIVSFVIRQVDMEAMHSGGDKKK